jgi:hypothetical protein
VEKRAYYVGKASTFRSLGFNPEGVKVAFVQEGISPLDANELIKEAWLGAAVGMAGRFGAKLLGRGVMAPASKLGLKTRAANWGAKQLGGAAGTLQKGTKALVANPMQTLKGSALEAGKGLVTFRGKGVGGALGRGAGYSSSASMLMPATQQAQQQVGQQMGQQAAQYGRYV